MHEVIPETDPDLDWMWAAAIFSVDPIGVGGVLVSPGSITTCDDWLRIARALLPEAAPWRRMPGHITDERLLGGLDLAATLSAGRPILARGLLAEVDTGVLVVPMAERLSRARVAQILDASTTGEVALERDGFTRRLPTRFGILALDESAEGEAIAPAIRDRLGIHLSLPSALASPSISDWMERVSVARQAVSGVTLSDDTREAICAAAVALGIASLNVAYHAVCVARISAALCKRAVVEEQDVARCARLVLGPRATLQPALSATPESTRDENPSPSDLTHDRTEAITAMAVAAARASLPPGLLKLLAGTKASVTKSTDGKSNGRINALRHGRSIGSRRGNPESGAQLHLIETLRAAAPWQKLRQSANAPGRIQVRSDDFRIRRLRHDAGSTSIFLVDASGSTALHRLAEAKGAIELLLSECYVRRDQVALIAFSGRGAEVLLPPTRSLARARRNLADLPGGGGTPLAAGLDAAALLAAGEKRKGQTPGLILLTDGKANVSRNGSNGRAAAEADALAAAKILRQLEIRSILVDTSPRPQAQAARLAEALGGQYLPLPNADSGALTFAARNQQRRSRV